MAQQKTQIEYINVDDLKAYERNARTHSDEGSVRISVSGEVIPGAAQRGCPL